MKDIELKMKQNAHSNEPFDYFFEVYDDKDVTVFANLTGYDLDEEEIKNSEARSYQLETMIYVKKVDEGLFGSLFLMGDNDMYANLNNLLGDKPCWTRDEFQEVIPHQTIDTIGNGFPYSYNWYHYVK